MGASGRWAEGAVSQGWGTERDTRKFISRGVQKGMRETRRASGELGFEVMTGSIMRQKKSGIMRNMLSCWRSCSELVMAPRGGEREGRRGEARRVWGGGRRPPPPPDVFCRGRMSSARIVERRTSKMRE